MRKLPIVVTCVAISLSLVGCASNPPTTASKSEGESSQSSLTAGQSSQNKSNNNTHYAGIYTVGVDIPAGGYVFTSEQLYIDHAEDGAQSHVIVHSDSSKKDYAISQYFIGNYYVSVSDGQILDVAGATFEPA